MHVNQDLRHPVELVVAQAGERDHLHPAEPSTEVQLNLQMVAGLHLRVPNVLIFMLLL